MLSNYGSICHGVSAIAFINEHRILSLQQTTANRPLQQTADTQYRKGAKAHASTPYKNKKQHQQLVSRYFFGIKPVKPR